MKVTSSKEDEINAIGSLNTEEHDLLIRNLIDLLKTIKFLTV